MAGEGTDANVPVGEGLRPVAPPSLVPAPQTRPVVATDSCPAFILVAWRSPWAMQFPFLGLCVHASSTKIRDLHISDEG